jgi:hypothetical protein
MVFTFDDEGLRAAFSMSETSRLDPTSQPHTPATFISSIPTEIRSFGLAGHAPGFLASNVKLTMCQDIFLERQLRRQVCYGYLGGPRCFNPEQIQQSNGSLPGSELPCYRPAPLDILALAELTKQIIYGGLEVGPSPRVKVPRAPTKRRPLRDAMLLVESRKRRRCWRVGCPDAVVELGEHRETLGDRSGIDSRRTRSAARSDRG